MTIDQLQQPIRETFRLYLQDYRLRTTSDIPLLTDVEQYLSQFPGKQIRPTLLLLSAQACQNNHEKQVILASAVELLHNASLMHDDVVDESDVRRGGDSVRHRWGNQVAVLCGDYYLSLVMNALQETNMEVAARLLKDTVDSMCRGELKQLSLVSKGPTTVENYIDIIGCKTAAMMSTCCELGACTPDNTDLGVYRQALRDYGYHYGLVFQMRDDLNDTNMDHDISLFDNSTVQSLIEEHMSLAREALTLLPDTPARQSLYDFLLPTAPQPTNQ